MEKKNGCSIPLMTGFLAFVSASMIYTGIKYDYSLLFWFGVAEGVIALLGLFVIIRNKLKTDKNQTEPEKIVDSK